MINTPYRHFTYTALFLALITVHLRAQVVLGTYEFDNTDGTNSAPANKAVSNEVANVTFSDFFLVGASENTGGKGAFSANKLATFGWNTGSQSWSDSLYVGFTVTANPGFALDLSSITLELNRANGTNSPRDGRMLVGTGDITTATPFTLFNNSNSASNADFQVGPIALTAFSGATSYNFFFQFSDTDVSTRLIRLDDVELSGTVVIPEPGSASLVLLVLGFAYCLAKRRK